MKIMQLILSMLIMTTIVASQSIGAAEATILEVKVVCTNNAALDDTRAQTHLSGSKVIGQPFDLPPDTTCSIIATKDAAADIVTAADNIAISIFGTGL